MPENNTAAQRGPRGWLARHNPLRWVKRHKKLTLVLVVLLLVVAFIVSSCMRTAQAVSNMLAYQFVRTTTLQKTSLTDSVSVSGTVSSGSTASVTASDSVKTFKVTSVNVAVGDTVTKGQVIATLDTSDVENQIENAQQSYGDNVDQAQTTYDQSVEDLSTNLTQAEQDLQKAQEDYDTLGLTDRYNSMVNPDTTDMNIRELVEYYYGLFAEEIAELENTVANLQIQLTQAQNDGNGDRVKDVQGQLENYQNQLNIAKGQCSIPELGLQGFDVIKQYYDSIDQYRQALDQAQRAYDAAATNSGRQVDSAETQLEQASRPSDTLTDLQSTLEDCTLTATMDGTITELNATVGSVCTGMQCNITSDATGDAVISGTLTRIDPVADEDGAFGATITVNGGDSGLLVGIDAQAEIIVQQDDNVFTVPRDAIGTREDGSTYVLRRTGGEGVDMTFEEVDVTTGNSNDYYIEISGDSLNEGDVIRSSSDMTQGIETANASDPFASMMGSGSMSVQVTGPSDGGSAPAAPAPAGEAGGEQ